MAIPHVIPLVEEALEKVETGTPDGVARSVSSALGYMVQTGRLIPPWPTRARDIYLRRACLENDHLDGLKYHAQMRLMATLPRFEAKKPTVTAHVEAAELFNERIYLASEFGEGLPVTLEKGSDDYLTVDNGMHLEVMGEGDPAGPIEGMPLGLRHLDSADVERTGHPIYPAIYRSPDSGKSYKFHFTRIISIAQMPSPIKSANGVGVSPVSRSFQIAQTLQDMLVYKLEKMGARPQTQVIYSDSMSATDIVKHFMVAEEMMSQLGLTRFAKIIALGNVKTLNKLDLNNFELFNEEIATLMAIYALAYIWGINVRTLFPYNTGGSSGDAELSDVIGRSQLPSAWMRSLRHQLNAKVCPPYLHTVFDNSNDEEDQQRAIIADIWARSRQRNMAAGVTTEMVERRLMQRNGEITREDFEEMELADGRLSDGTPVATLFETTDKVIKPLLLLEGVRNPLVIEDNEAQAMKRAIHLAQGKVYKVIAATASQPQLRRIKQALAALDWLDRQYQIAPPPIEVETPFARLEQDGRTTDQEPTTAS